MLAWMKQISVPGVPEITAFGDDGDAFTFYLLAKAPSFRLDPKGMPVFKFLKYKMPVDRQGKKGGGFLICDVAFVIPDATLQKAKAALQEMVDAQFPNLNPKRPVKINNVGFTRAACGVQLLDGGGPNAVLVERVQNPAAPSLYGDMITPITVELSPEGATLLEQALQDKGGVVQVWYDLFAPVKLPDMTVTVWFHADKFMEFQQQVDIDWSFWGDDSYRETIRERFTQSEAGGVTVDPGGITDAKIVNAARDWGFQQLDDAVKRMVLGDIAPVSDDDRKVPDGIEHVWRDRSVQKTADFRRVFRQGNVIEVNIGPRGTLPNITSMLGGDGKPLKWSDYAATVDLDDPFFKRVSVNYRANVDFDTMPVKSVDVRLKYGTSQPKGASFVNANDIGKAEWSLESNNWKYKYQYTVNYKNESRAFTSQEVDSDAPNLTINVGQAGILHAEVSVGDIDFAQVTQAFVTLSYEDTGNGVPPKEWPITLTNENRKTVISEPIFAARSQPFRYQVKYAMKDGRQFVGSPQTTQASQIYIGDPFSANKTIAIRSTGNLDTDIATIFVDLKYRDDKNSYSQTFSTALSKTQRFADWTFPVVDETGGIVTYVETVQYADGNRREYGERPATKSTILVGQPVDDEFVTVDILPDLLDFTALKLVKVSMHYKDAANDIDNSKDFIFKSGAQAQQYKVRIADKTKREYTYTIQCFKTDGTQQTIGPKPSSDTSLVLQV